MRRMISFAHGYMDVLLAMVIAVALIVGPGIRAAGGATAGGTWTIVASPNVGVGSQLNDVAASGGAAWAVGWGCRRARCTP
jgi:hypothetical protein